MATRRYYGRLIARYPNLAVKVDFYGTMRRALTADMAGSWKMRLSLLTPFKLGPIWVSVPEPYLDSEQNESSLVAIRRWG